MFPVSQIDVLSLTIVAHIPSRAAEVSPENKMSQLQVFQNKTITSFSSWVLASKPHAMDVRSINPLAGSAPYFSIYSV
jgi:hypothetical protein